MPYRRALFLSGRQPFELVILVTCVIAGIGGLIADPARPTAVQIVLGPWAWAFHLGLLLGGVVSLLGVWLQVPICLFIERVAMVWLATLFLVYGTALFAVNGQLAVTSATFALGCGVAAVARIVQISRALKLVKTLPADDLEVIIGTKRRAA